MERSNYGAYGRMQDQPTGRALEGRASVESQRLGKKRSNPTVRNPSQPLPASPPADRGPRGGAAPSGDGGQTRKGSLRNAVRKFFGRKSKEVEPTAQHRSPPRHAYHVSEPPKLETQTEEVVLPLQEQAIPQRTLSAPMHALPSPTFDRVKTPYAVEFPQSARLKPIKLGDPFNAPGSQLRRRKTLPSVLLNEDDAATVGAAVGRPPVPKREPFDDSTPSPDLTRHPTVRSAKRMSRSAENLNWQRGEGSPSRKRSEEIRYWRESYQGSVLHNSVLRASGFVSKEPRDVGLEGPASEVTQPPAQPSDDPFTAPVVNSVDYMRSSPPQPGPFSEADFRSASGYGTELSRDLEDRVARLEAGLQSFQQSLARLTADRNRRTVLVGGVPARRSSLDARTPSMLADTLSDPLVAAAWGYGAVEPERPSTASPASPHTPIRADTRRPPVPAVRTERLAGPFTTPAPTSHHHTSSSLTNPPPLPPPPPPPDHNPNDGGTSSNQPPPYTFRSLYEMLADERSARRQLERQLRDNASQLRNLRQEISELQYQVSVGSHLQSQRSSYQPVLDPAMAAGSSRLAALLRGTEGSPPGTAHGGIEAGVGQQFQSFGTAERASDEQGQSQRFRLSNLTTGTAGTGRSMSTNAGNVTSRFSGSDSGASGTIGGAASGGISGGHIGNFHEEEEELSTPYEAYQTPRGEDAAYFPFSSAATATAATMRTGSGGQDDEGEGEMF